MKDLPALPALAFGLISILALGCSPPPYQNEIRLETGGYGYEVGDVVLIDSQKAPALGDIVQFDTDKNNSRGRAFGPNLFLAKVIGLPGDNVSFQQWTYKVNGYEVTLGPYFLANGTKWAQTENVMWGSEKFINAANMTLRVPENQFLGDRQIGEEFSRETDQTGSSKVYRRFTVKREAITGVVLKKLGHDKEFEDRQKSIVY